MSIFQDRNSQDFHDVAFSIPPVGMRLDAVQSVYGIRALQRVNEDLGFSPSTAPRSASLYDVDGVLTNPLTKSVHPELLEELRYQLRNGEIVAFNTGRSAEWLLHSVVARLCELFSSSELAYLENLFIAAEKGAIWIEYSAVSGFQAFCQQEVSVPHYLSLEAQNIIASFDEPRMALDQGKEAMVSLEFSPCAGQDLNDEFQIFVEQRVEVERQLQKLLRDAGLEDSLTIDVTSIAIDIQHKEMGKDLGAERVLRWLSSKSDFPDHVTTYGDSKSDLAMAVFLHGKGISVQHVHVGDDTHLSDTAAGIDVYIPARQFHEGTSEHREEVKRTLNAPGSNAELLSSFHTMEGLTEHVAPWYDRVFLSANRIDIDEQSKIIRIHISGEASPVSLDDSLKHRGVSSVHDISQRRPGISTTDDFRMIGGDEDDVILISGGVVPFISDGNSETILFLQRGMGAPVAAGQLQTAAGRCDRPVGHCSYQELSEEYLLTAERDGKLVFLGIANDSLGTRKQLETIRGAARNVVHELELRMSILESGDVRQLEGAVDLSETGRAFELASVRNEIKRLQAVDEVVMIDPQAIGNDAINHRYAVETYLDGTLVEQIEGMHAVYVEDSNTLEMRVPITLQLTAYGLHALKVYDGDGFGRNIITCTPEEALNGELLLHTATRTFLEDIVTT